MLKKIIILMIVAMISMTGSIFAQEDNQQVIQGKISQIADDESYIIINGKKILTPQEFTEEYYFEQGDELKVVVKQDTDGLKAVALEYMYEEAPNNE